MSFDIGQKVGPYEVVDYFDNLRIGAGYMVKNTALDRVEILRLLPKDPHHDRESVDRFLREIIVHSRLAHPNIVAFYSALDIDGNLVMTTEYVPGVTLGKRIEQGGISTAEAVTWACQILSALAYAHENGVVHREVSPANIVITESGEAKLGGFGLAKGLNDPELTRIGTVMGWIEYMSPEQVQGLPRVDVRSDIYSTGAVLYEMVTGRVPFQASSQFEVMLAHVRETPRPPTELNPQVQADLSAVILQALEKDPEKRFATAQAFREALEATVVRTAPKAEPEIAAEAAVITEAAAAAPAASASAVVETAKAAEPAQAAAAPNSWAMEPAAAITEPAVSVSAVVETAKAAAEPTQAAGEPASPPVEPPVETTTEALRAMAAVTPPPEEQGASAGPSLWLSRMEQPQVATPAAPPEAAPPAAEAPASVEPKAAPASAFTWRPKTEEEIEAEQRAQEAELPAAHQASQPPPLPWSRPENYIIPEIPDIPDIPPVPEVPGQQLPSLEALLAEDPLSVAAARGYVRPPMAAVDAVPAEPLPTWKLVIAGAGAFVLVGLTMYAVLRSLGG